MYLFSGRGRIVPDRCWEAARRVAWAGCAEQIQLLHQDCCGRVIVGRITGFPWTQPSRKVQPFCLTGRPTGLMTASPGPFPIQPDSAPTAPGPRPLTGRQQPVYQQWGGRQQTHAPRPPGHQRPRGDSQHLTWGHPVRAGACGRHAHLTSLGLLGPHCRAHPRRGKAAGSHSAPAARPRLPREVSHRVPTGCPHVDQVLPTHHPT